MRPNEAKWIGHYMARLDTAAISPCVNLGSSTGSFRMTKQPHIDKYIFAPLRERGINLIHVDIKKGDGIDIAGDIFESSTVNAISSQSPMCVICCNMFEHVQDREELAHRVSSLLPSGGLLIVSVPYSYPVHYDPIDTYFRPTPEEIHSLFNGFEMVEGGIISDSTYLEDLVENYGIGGTALQFARSALKFFMVWRGKRHWIGHFHRYLWLFQPYRVSYAVLRKK